jgi:hypothetical protein
MQSYGTGNECVSQKAAISYENRRKVIRDAKNRVPVALGERFSQVVLRCLKFVETFAVDAEHDLFIGLK